jgi:hypothetical protein
MHFCAWTGAAAPVAVSVSNDRMSLDVSMVMMICRIGE